MSTELKKLIKSVLKEQWVNIKILDYTIKEDVENKVTHILDGKVLISDDFDMSQTLEIKGKGTGFFDAILKSLVGSLIGVFSEAGYISKVKISSIEIKPSNMKKFNLEGSESTASCEIVVKSARRGESFDFGCWNQFSMNQAVCCATCQVVEFFLNAKKALAVLQYALQDAKKRYRDDLVQVYTKKLIELVKVVDQ